MENYVNFGVGRNEGTQNILEFEPVVPVHLNADRNLINRAIIPVVWNPDLSPAPSVPQAFAPTDFSAFLSPRNPVHGWTWGVGPIVQLPTATSPTVGSSVWGAGPTAAAVHTSEHIVAGLLVDQLWSFGGVETGAAGAMRSSSWNPSSTTISARAGSPSRRQSSPTANTRAPLIDTVITYDKRIMQMVPGSEQVILGDEKRIEVTSFTEFRIADPLGFFQSVGSAEQARPWLFQIVSSSLRRELGKVKLAAFLSAERDAVTERVQTEVSEKAKPLGIDVVSVRVRRADLPGETSQAIYDRMLSESQREAKELRAQGFEWAQSI